MQVEAISQKLSVNQRVAAKQEPGVLLRQKCVCKQEARHNIYSM